MLDTEDGMFAAANDADLQQDDEARDLVAEVRGARAAAEASVLHMVLPFEPSQVGREGERRATTRRGGLSVGPSSRKSRGPAVCALASSSLFIYFA